MDTKQPEALRIANTALQVRNKDTPDDVYVALGDCAWALRNLHAENERLRAGDDAARHEIANLQERVQQLGQLARDVNSRRVMELEAQLEAVGAGGVEPLRKRRMHQISEPQAQPVAWAIFAENGNGLVWTQNKGHAEASAKNVGLQVTPLYAAPQSAVPRNAPLYSPDDVAFPVQRSADGVDALPPELTSIAAAEVTAPSGPAREPLSQERLQFLSGEYEDIPEEGVAFRDGWRSAEMHHGITAAQKGGQHGF